VNLSAARKLIHHLTESVKLLVELLPQDQSPEVAAMMTRPALPAVSTPPPAVPKKKAAKKATRKYSRRPKEVLEYDADEDEDDDEQPAQKMTAAVSMGDAVEKVGVFIGKKGLYDKFTGDDVRKVFPGGIESATLTYALNQWISKGAIERTEKGNRQKPSSFKKVKVMDGED
jgi:hypothetical protein